MASSKLKISFISVFITIFSIFLLIFPQQISAQTILFQDNFDDGNAAGWEVFGTQGWIVKDGQYGIHLDPGVSISVPSSWNYLWKNIKYEVDLRGVSGTDKNILIEYKDPGNFLELHHSGGSIEIKKYISDTGSMIGYSLGSTQYQLNNGVTYHFRFDLLGKNLKVYINGNQVFDVDDIFQDLGNWKVGLRAGTGAESPTEVWFDNVVVTELATPSATPTVTPSPTPTATPLPTLTPIPTPTPLNVPDIKQYSLPWADKIYDNARSWSNNPFIKRWGCALTSATMVLNFFGHNTNPDSLNNWLVSQPDGYVGSGLVNWLAVSRYTLQHSTGSIPALEYRRLAGTTSNLVSELTNGRPSILDEVGHFVVAKGQTPTSFLINDPAYSDRPTLDSYGNTFVSIGSYRPTHTDLSYIMLTSPQSITVKVSSPSGSVIDGYSYTENPLKDDLDNGKNSGSPLNLFLLPVPVSGTYDVEITGNGLYNFNSYLYDPLGNVSLFSKQGIISPGEKDNFKLTIGAQNQTDIKIDIDTLIQDLEDIYRQKLIKNKHIYINLKGHLFLIKWAIEHNKIHLARALLNAFRMEVIRSHHLFMDYSAKKILLEDSSALLKQLR